MPNPIIDSKMHAGQRRMSMRFVELDKKRQTEGKASIMSDDMEFLRKKAQSVLHRRSSYSGKNPLQCRFFHTRDSSEKMTDHEIDNPKSPYLYKPPFRRNFRYFGYPRDLNPDLHTPPRVRSWGPIPEQIPRMRPAREQFHCKVDPSVDPYWPGRLVKNSTMLENPTLVPVMGKAIQHLDVQKKPVTLVKPELELTNCVSEHYFPLSESNRTAFCRINKITKEGMAKQVHEFTVQNPHLQKNSMSMREVRRSEIGKKRKTHPALNEKEKSKRQSHFTLLDIERKTEDIVFYEKATTPEILKVFCLPESYPGKNKQLYGRPADVEDTVEVKGISSDDEFLRLRARRLSEAYQQFSVPEDLWEKLSKVRARKQQQERARAAKKRNRMDFKTFTQLEMRNIVLGEAKLSFLEQLNRDINTPLPPELFDDNRDKPQPPHDYLDDDEFPAQGPYWWKSEEEGPPTEEESTLIDGFIESLKEHHNFTHHLPGLIFVSRHPFPVLELDWYEPGAEMATPMSEKRKSPKHLHDYAYHVAQLNDELFEEHFLQAVKEKAKDLVGPEIYEMYKQLKGIPASPTESQLELEREAAEEEEEERLPRKIRVKRLKVKKEEEKEEEEEEKKDGMDDQDEEDEEEDEEDDEEEEEVDLDALLNFEGDPVYNLEHDLQQEEEYPLPDVHFSEIDFTQDDIPDNTLSEAEKKVLRKALGSLENAEPIKKVEEEILPTDQDSDTSTDSELNLDEPEPPQGKDPVDHLQEMYQDAMKRKYKSQRIISPKKLIAPDLKDIFLQNTFIEDIENLLDGDTSVPPFLQLF